MTRQKMKEINKTVMNIKRIIHRQNQKNTDKKRTMNRLPITAMKQISKNESMKKTYT